MGPPPLPQNTSSDSVNSPTNSRDCRKASSEFVLRLAGVAAAVLLGLVCLYLAFNYARSLSFTLPAPRNETTNTDVNAQLAGGDTLAGQHETRIADSAEGRSGANEASSSVSTSEAAPPLDSGTEHDHKEIVGELRLYTSRDRSASTDENAEINPFASQSDTVQSVVFVIDVSSSMTSQERLPRVSSSLKEAIQNLRENQRFNILLFNDHFTSFSPTQGLVRASAEFKRVACDYLDSTFATGGTNPLPAITSAIRCSPERIVVLSDGEFDPLIVKHATTYNQSKKSPSIIDCIGVDEQVMVLRDLASQNGGVYFQAK